MQIPQNNVQKQYAKSKMNKSRSLEKDAYKCNASRNTSLNVNANAMNKMQFTESNAYNEMFCM